MTISIKPETVLKLLLSCIGLLVSAHLAGMFLWHVLGYDYAMGFVPLFRLDAERNFPTLYSTIQLTAASFVLLLICAIENKRKLQWFLLALAFLFLSADEFIGFHEMLAVKLGGDDSEAILQFAWLIPYLLGTLVFAAAFIPFLLALPRRTATIFVLSGAAFVTAAIGVEALTGLTEASGYSVTDPRQRGLATVEETLEMSSIAVFIYGLLDYIRMNHSALSFKFPGNQRT